jgi:transcriptional regulator with XRE-family HTH domain
MENLYVIIGERIKEKRKELNVKQQKLADEVNINRTSISNIEKGRHQPPLHLLFKICFYLNLDIHSLIPSLEEIANLNNKETPGLFKILYGDNSLSENSKNDIETVLNNLD